MMIIGMVYAGLTYRDMREQRVLNEPVSLMKFSLAESTPWQTVTLPLYQTGDHGLYIGGERSFKNISTQEHPVDSILFPARFDVVVEDPLGEKIINKSLTGVLREIPKASGMTWIVIDTLHLPNIGSGDWKLSARVAVADTTVHTLSELLLIPPHSAEFNDYVGEQTPKLFSMGILIIAGFCATVFGGYLNRRSL